MSSSAESGASGAGSAALLVECDRRGQVLWMSDGARAAFGHSETVMQILWKSAPSGAPDLLRPGSAPRFSPVFQQGDSLWISAELAARAQAAAREEAAELLNLQSDFVRHYFRLQDIERTLSARARKLHPRRVPSAIEQVERERERLGRELHTSVGQMLAAIRLQLEIIAAQTAGAPEAVRQALDRIGSLAGDALEQVRSISRRLHPPEWQRLTLEVALTQLWNLSGIPQRFEASLDLQRLENEPPLETRIVMYRAAQEALSNLTRHSRATRVHMSLRVSGPMAILTVEDNGVGFDAERWSSGPASVGAGIGLRSIREQAAALGGNLVAQSGPEGTKLEISVPVSSMAPHGTDQGES